MPTKYNRAGQQQPYENEDYQMLMKNAILMKKPLTKDDIVNFFGNDYDYVEKDFN